MRTTQRKGDTATAIAIGVLTKCGWDVSIPLTESAAYDLIVDVPDEGLKRVQVKYTSNPDVGLRHIHSNARGYVVSKPKTNAYDWLVVYFDYHIWLHRGCPQSSYIRVTEKNFEKL